MVLFLVVNGETGRASARAERLLDTQRNDMAGR